MHTVHFWIDKNMSKIGWKSDRSAGKIENTSALRNNFNWIKYVIKEQTLKDRNSSSNFKILPIHTQKNYKNM